MAITIADLDAIAGTLSLARNGTGPVEPGQRVDVSVVSSLSELTVLDLLPVPVVHPVRLTVTWSVTGPGGSTPMPGVDYLVSQVAGLAAGFLLKPPIKPLVTDMGAAALDEWKIHASVTVEAAGLVVRPPELVLPLSLAPLRVPELVALFRHTYFAPYDSDSEPGFVLLIVPDWSPIRAIGDTFNGLMEQLDLAMRPLRTLAGVAGFLTGIEALRLAASGQPMTRVHVGDVPDLEQVHMRVETNFGSDYLNKDLRAGDRTSAIVVFGPPDTTVNFYDDEEYDLSHNEWAFEVTTGLEMAVLLPGLRSSPLTTMPPGRERVIQPGGGSSFNDNLTSVRFGKHHRHQG